MSELHLTPVTPNGITGLPGSLDPAGDALLAGALAPLLGSTAAVGITLASSVQTTSLEALATENGTAPLFPQTSTPAWGNPLLERSRPDWNATPDWDMLTGTTEASPWVGSFTLDPLVPIPTVEQFDVPQQLKAASFNVVAEGTITVNGRGDFAGDPTNDRDDARLYAGKGITFTAKPTLAVQRDEQGNLIRDRNGKVTLVEQAVAVAAGATVTTPATHPYSNLDAPQIVEPQTVVVPDYEMLKQQTLAARLPQDQDTTMVTLDLVQTPIAKPADWSRQFSTAGTAEQPTLVHVIGGSLTIPARVSLSHTIIVVEQGDITLTGSGHKLDQVTLIANRGSINLANVRSTNLAALASESITMGRSARFAGETLLANGSSHGSITFGGATASVSEADRISVIAQGSITYNGAAPTRGLFLSTQDVTSTSSQTLFGSIAAKGNITFNGAANVAAIEPTAAPTTTVVESTAEPLTTTATTDNLRTLQATTMSTNNRFDGRAGDDTYYGGAGNDLIFGNGGNDFLSGQDGNDTIYGGNGWDRIYGGNGTDTLHGENGNDEIGGGMGNDTIYGGDGQDNLGGNDGDDTISGGGGADEVYGGEGHDTLSGDDDNDIISGWTGDDKIYGGNGNDRLLGDDGNDVIDGQAGSNTAFGGYGNDWIAGGEGRDELWGEWDNDTLAGRDGNDLLVGGTGDDYLLGEHGDDEMYGEDGNDSLVGGSGNDTLWGQQGNDVLWGDAGNDILLGGAGDDFLRGHADNVAVGLTEDDTLYGEQGADTLAGETGNDTLYGGLDNDTLYGNEGNDTLYGNEGNDWLDGGQGIDRLEGGDGNDTYLITDSSDSITDTSGIDTVRSTLSYSLGSTLEHLTLEGAAIAGTGNSLDNIITGNSTNNTLQGLDGNDTLIGNDGNDTLNGGVGVDRLEGGLGNDSYVVDHGSDTVIENFNSGIDTVTASVTYSLGSNIEELWLAPGAGTISGTGNALNNTITGNEVNNRLDGGAGADRLRGGLGDDIYIVDNLADMVVEDTTTGGADRVEANITFTLSANVENLLLTGTGSINGTGNAIDNTLTGNSGNNVLSGGAGNDVLTSNAGDDTLDGGLGIDTLIGGAGNDTYIVDSLQDVVNESNATEGTADRVRASISYTLGANIEILELIESATTGQGNASNNTLIGNSSNNVLNGGAGADLLRGGAGDDTYFVDSSDTVQEDFNSGIDIILTSGNYSLGANVENLTLQLGAGDISGTGNALNNTITGNQGSNRLDGGLGADRLDGGLGNDTYVVDHVGDVVVENSSAGIDLVQASISYSLGATIENLQLLGTNNLTGTGNALANTIIGNVGSNVLDGGLGADTLIGGDGNDTYIVNSVADAVVEASAVGGIDRVESSVTFTLGSNLENLVLSGANHLNGGGNELGNTIIGNSGRNEIDGHSGDDWLAGEAGDDTLRGGEGRDTLMGGNGSDILSGGNDNDVLQGSASGGAAQIDRLTGGAGADHFILGTSAALFYDDGNAATTGSIDYALITDFNPLEGDLIELQGATIQGGDIVQLQGNPNQYFLALSPAGLPEGIAIYRQTLGTEQPELIGIIQSRVVLSLTEGTAFNTEQEIEFTTPTTPSILSFKFAAIFDEFTSQGMNDAFEVALVDGQGAILAHTVSHKRDAFLNWTEGEGAALGVGASYDAATQSVQLNLTGIASNIKANLRFRLVNNDRDTATQVEIRDLFLTPAPKETQPPTGALASPLSSSNQAIDFASLADVSPSFTVEYHRTSLNRETNLLYADVALKNINSHRTNAPLVLAIKNISDPSVRLHNPDGYTPEGLPYYNFSQLVDDSKLDPNGTTAQRSLVFFNPNQVQFTYDVSVLSQLNQAPEIQTQPVTEIIVGQQYRYDIDAIDFNQDRLTYRLLEAPDEMEIDSQAGIIAWSTTNVLKGSYVVSVEVSDGQGGFAQQLFNLSVIEASPNRPPIWTSTPLVDARVNTAYSYQATAVDADGDGLTFALTSAPKGMSIDASTGTISWTPTDAQLGLQTIVLSVTDGNGGNALQRFQIWTQMEANNHAPFITSTASATAYTSTTYTYEVRAVDPDGDALVYSLVSSPDGMEIDTNTGEIRWQTPVAGQQNVVVKVTDGRGGSDVQTFTLAPSGVTPGQITGKVFVDNRQPKTQTVYFEDFEDPTELLTEWSSVFRDIASKGGQRFLGRYGGPADNEFQPGKSGTSLTLVNLPEHDSLTVSFDLYILDSWDGYGSAPWQPDLWKLSLEGESDPIFLTAFDHYYDSQVYPGQVDSSDPDLYPNQYAADETFTLTHGYDAVYKLSFTIPHSNTNIKLAFSGEGSTSLFRDGESWGIDNVKIVTNNRNVDLEPNPTPIAGATIYLDQNDNGKLDPGEISTVTDTQGNYAFTLAPGATYKVAPAAKLGWNQSIPKDRTYAVTLGSGEVVQGIDFGNIVASADNVAPSFLSTPPLTAMANRRFNYQAVAADPNGDDLTYELVVRPEGMAVDAESGVIVWQPKAEQVGLHRIILRVRDPQGEVALQAFQLNVSPFNNAPVFISGFSPLPQAVAERLYQYQFRAIDADGDRIQYSLQSRSASQVTNAQINPDTGLFSWTPQSAQLGLHAFEIVIEDGRGGRTTLPFGINVASTTAGVPNRSPVITSAPRTTAQPRRTYFYQVEATDPDGDLLEYELLTPIQGMTIEEGVLTWTPTVDQLGSQDVVLQVRDRLGGATTQSFQIAVTNQITTNDAPVITSTPNLITNLDRAYQYALIGVDPDGDVFRWSLDRAPQGMSIDAVSGALRWQPTAEQVGLHDVSVRLIDALGSSGRQTFTLRVNGTNLAPTIYSTPITQAVQGQQYTYSLVASDPESDVLTFELGNRPRGMDITRTGEIRWTPQADQMNPQVVEVLVTDAQGATSTQTFTIQVGNTASNRIPRITSIPKLLTAVSQPYTYQIQALDPDAGDTLSYQLLQPPVATGSSQMEINAATGLLTWNAPTLGRHSIVVAAEDSRGLRTAQSFTLIVRDNQAPVLQSIPNAAVTVETLYGYDVRAVDPDGDRLSYTLDPASLSKGLTIDAFGRLRWTPQPSDVTAPNQPLPITVTVTDALGATVTQQIALNVIQDREKPLVNLVASTNRTEQGNTVTFWAQATDNVGVANLQLVVGGQSVMLDRQGMATLTLDQAGLISAEATAIDRAGNSSNAARLTIEVLNPNSTQFDPSVMFDLPDVVTAPTAFAVAGEDIVTGEDVMGYRIEVISVETGISHTLVESPALPADGKALFDPSLLENDVYDVQLTVFGNNGGRKTFTDTVSVEGELKLGNFRVSFTDLTIPVTGIPITLTRTYDTLTTGTSDDFGHGWRMEFRDTDLRTSIRRNRLAAAYDLDDPSLRQSEGLQAGTKVFLTLPGGQRQSFTFQPQPLIREGINLGAFGWFQPTFVADRGNTSTLTIESNSGTERTLVQHSTGQYTYGSYTYDPAQWGDRYVVTTKEGTRYEIDATTGDLLTVQDLNGNFLTYTEDAIISSTGQQITFRRSPDGRRIEAVQDLKGELIHYEYDPATGNLIGVTDREGHKTIYKYEEVTRPHYLTGIIDPLNRPVMRTDYNDATGRLEEIIDANDTPVKLEYNLDESKQIILDSYGQPTLYFYDSWGNIVREVDAEGRITERRFDASTNDLLAETITTDRSGRLESVTTTYTYDPRGNKLTETNPLGKTSISTYGAFSRLLTETNPLGHTTTYTYDASGNLRTSRDAKQQVTTYNYDPLNGNLLSFTTANQPLTQFRYDSRGYLDRLEDALGNVTTYINDANGNRTREIRTVTRLDGTKETLTTIWDYDDNGRLRSVTDPENGTTTYVYDAAGQQTALIDALGRRTQYRYDNRGQLVETILPDETPQTLTDNPRTIEVFDRGGRRRASIDQSGRVTHYIYDVVGRLVTTIHPQDGETLSQFLAAIAPGQSLSTVDWTQVIYPDAPPSYLFDNPRTQTEYYLTGEVETQIDEWGNRTEFRYDQAGRLTETIYADTTSRLTDNPRTIVKYDDAGRRIEEIDALQHKTTFKYDEVGRLIKTTFHNNTSVQTTYDALGRKQTMTDQEGRTTEYRYDALGRLTGVKDAKQLWTEYGYDEVGRLVWAEDANDRRTYYEYDKAGRRTAVILPLSQRSTTVYDKAGNIEYAIDFNGARTNFIFDAQNRLTRKDFMADGTSIAYTYTPTSQVKTITDSQGLTEFRYDERDRLIARRDPQGARTSDGYTIEYGYDAASNRTWVETPTGTTSYVFDERNRLHTVTDSSQGVTTYWYDAANRLDRTERPNGVIERREYNSVNQLEQIKNVTRDAFTQQETVLTSHDYGLDKVGHRLSVTDHTGRKVEYNYDELYRLEQEKVTEGGQVVRTVDYRYDNVGNRLSQIETQGNTTKTTTYQYDWNDRLEWEQVNAVTTTIYQYDNNGNTTRKTEAGTTTTYEWNQDGRLTGVNAPDKVLRYTYDSEGIRTSASVNGVTTQFLVDHNRDYAQVLEERVNGNLTVRYTYGNDLISQQRGTQTSFYLVDGLGSTIALTDAQGTLTDSYTYQAFGETEGQTGTTANVYRFAGEQWDEQLGEYYLRDRYYDADTGRFTRRDTYEGRLGEPLTLHKYLYAHANPANFTDPTGLFTMADTAAANSVRNILAGIQLESGGHLVSATLAGRDYGVSEFLLNFSLNLFISLLAIPVGVLGRGGAGSGAGNDFAGFSDGTTRVYRVESEANTRILVNAVGEVVVQGDGTLFLNFGQRARAEEFLQRRLLQYPDTPSQIKSFEVPNAYVDELRATAVRERNARRPELRDRPIVVDRAAPDQFGLRTREHIERLRNAIIQGSGKVEP